MLIRSSGFVSDNGTPAVPGLSLFPCSGTRGASIVHNYLIERYVVVVALYESPRSPAPMLSPVTSDLARAYISGAKRDRTADLLVAKHSPLGPIPANFAYFRHFRG